MILNILNNKQKKELLKLFENKVHVPKGLDINPLGLMHEVAKALLKMHEVAKALLIASDKFFDYEVLNNYDLKRDLEYSIRENLINCLDTEHFIYCWDAMDYLREEDYSLRESLEIAKENGLQDITSTKLANLLYHQKQIGLIDRISFDYILETLIKNQ
jgi:hypothetical protein